MTLSIVRAEQHPGIALAVVRRQVAQSELSSVVPEGCGLVWSFLRARNLRGGRNVALYWDDAIRLEVGVEFADQFPSEGEVVRSSTPAGIVAAVTHLGPYGQLGQAHQAIHGWCAENQRRLAGPSWEVYGHWENAWNSDPRLIRTDVYYLLAD